MTETKKRGRPRTAEHGTRGRYTRGCFCDDCRAANTRYQHEYALLTGRRKYGAELWEKMRPKWEDNPHGTSQRYDSGKCRCDACREAKRLSHMDWRARALERPVPDHVHGENGYGNYGCRCSVCYAAHSELMRQNRAKRRPGS